MITARATATFSFLSVLALERKRNKRESQIIHRWFNFHFSSTDGGAPLSIRSHHTPTLRSGALAEESPGSCGPRAYPPRRPPPSAHPDGGARLASEPESATEQRKDTGALGSNLVLFNPFGRESEEEGRSRRCCKLRPLSAMLNSAVRLRTAKGSDTWKGTFEKEGANERLVPTPYG